MVIIFNIRKITRNHKFSRDAPQPPPLGDAQMLLPSLLHLPQIAHRSRWAKTLDYTKSGCHRYGLLLLPQSHLNPHPVTGSSMRYNHRGSLDITIGTAKSPGGHWWAGYGSAFLPFPISQTRNAPTPLGSFGHPTPTVSVSGSSAQCCMFINKSKS